MRLPALRRGIPIYYRGDLVAIIHGRGVLIGEPLPAADRRVVQTMALVAREHPGFSPEQQLTFAAYRLLPDETFTSRASLSDEAIAEEFKVPIDLVRFRRRLPCSLHRLWERLQAT